MNIRPKTVRRLFILFAASVVVAGVVVLWLALSQRRISARIAAVRRDAVAAYDAGDYAGAVSLFGDYLTRSHSQDSDADAVFDYAHSLANLPAEGGRHRYEAIRLLEHYLTLWSNDPRDARHLLLKLYTQARFNKEALGLAERLLALNPSDFEALGSRAQSLEAEASYSEALAAYHRLNQLAPHNLTSQIHELDLMSRTQRPTQQIVQHARELVQRRPDDPAAHALMAVANLLYAQDDAAAKKDLQAAAKFPPTDPDTVLQIVRLLDLRHEFQLSDDLLNRAIARFPQAPQLLRQIVQRDWQRRLPSDVIVRLEKLNRSSGDPALLGYEAMALYESNRAADAKPLLDVLKSHKDDISTAWTIALQTAYVAPPAPALAIHAYADAVIHDPTNPVFYAMLGQSYQAIGETDQAIRQWKDAGRLSPCWALPYCLISRALCATGRYSEAVGAAETAHQRLPGSQVVETSYAWAWYGLDELSKSHQADAKERDALLSLLESIQKAWKNEPLTLPFYVTMLSQRGHREAAIQVVQQALATEPLLSAQTLLQLESVSRQEKLELEEQVLDRAGKAYAGVASIAFARATNLARGGKIREAIRSYDEAARQYSQGLNWQLARAQLSDALGEPDALQRWSTLTQSNPQDLTVQYALLRSKARLQDRALWRHTIDRVKSITGSEGQVGQLEDVRWRLAGNPSSKELGAIAASLQKIVGNSPSLPEPHRLLADALLRQDAPDTVAKAVAELTAAHDLDSADPEATEALAELLTSQGLRDQAIVLVDGLAQDPQLSTERRLWAAGLYAKLGRSEAGIKLLTDPKTQIAPDAAREMLLAQLYRRTGRSREAAALYLNILDAPASSADALAAGAEFFADLKQSDVVARFVERLSRMPLKAGALAVLRAHLDQIAGEPEQAVFKLAAAAKESPKVEQVWQELSGALLRIGKLDAADKAAADGLAANPASPALTAMRLQIARLRGLSPQEVGPLLEVLSHEPQNPIVDQAMKLLAESKARSDASDRVLSSLRPLADQHARFLPLQELLVERYTAVGRLKDAADLASRASATAPDDPEPLRLLCAVQSAAGNWDAVRQAALRWRQVLGENAVDADLTIARSYLQQPKPDSDSAIAQLAPYIAQGAPDAARKAAMPTYCRALIEAARSADAAALLGPSLAQSRPSRLVWLQLAGVQKSAAAATDWLRKIVPLISNSIEERLSLADAWEQVGQHYDSQAAHEAARDVLQPIVDGPNVPPQAWSAWAAINQSLGDVPQAERAWREYLKQRPSEPPARNNLAYMLLLQGKPDQLAEAEQLSRSAIADAPGVSTFYDTLARIQLRLGKTDEAVKNFHAALDRNRDNLEAMIGLADVLQTRPQDRDEAKSLLARIDTALRAGAPIPALLRGQLDRVKSALSSSL